MTNQQHSITPPLELVDKWNNLPLSTQEIIVIAWRHGADQELEACCEWLEQKGFAFVDEVRAARRPKPPSLAEEALALIRHDPANQPFLSKKGIDTLRRALERLQQLEDSND